MNDILFELSCGHRDQGTIRNAQIQRCLCHTCGTDQKIEKVVHVEWFSMCYDCTHKRWWGDDQEAAKDAARRHWLKNNSHRPSYAKGSRPKSREARDMFDKRNIKVANDSKLW